MTKADDLERFPFYEEGKVPQYHKYHPFSTRSSSSGESGGTLRGSAGCDGRDGAAYGNRGPKAVRERLGIFRIQWNDADLTLMQEQHLNLVKVYEKLDIKAHYSSWSDEAPRSARP